MAQFDANIEITIDKSAFDKFDRQAEYTFYAKYAASILKGFYYKNLRRHPAWAWDEQTLAAYDIEAEISKRLAAGESFEDAFDGMAEDLKASFQDTLKTAPVRTLRWFVRDYTPSEFVHLQTGQEIPVIAYDPSQVQ